MYVNDLVIFALFFAALAFTRPACCVTTAGYYGNYRLKRQAIGGLP